MFDSISQDSIRLKSGQAHYHRIDNTGAEESTLAQQPIHFFHATAYPFGSYIDMLHRLSDKHSVFGLAHRGCWEGHSGPKAQVQWHSYADDLIDFLDQKKCGPVVGMGHSIGAVTTMFAAIKRPDLFSALVLIDPVFVAPPIWYMSRLAKLMNKPIPMEAVARRRPNQWNDREEAVAFHQGKRAFSRFTSTSMEAYGHFGIKETDKGFGLTFCRDWEAHIYSSVPYVWRQLPKLNLPTLGLRGVHSDVITEKTWRRWQKIRPNDTLVSLKECGHLLPHERPEECASHIKEFLAAL